ncbi:unnamed protein product, partial [Effrenium voratum]
QSLIVVEGNYWEAPVTLCGTVERVEEDGAGVVVEVRLSGTENEDLLKWRKYRELWLTGCVELPIQRPLLSALNHIWSFIKSFEGDLPEPFDFCGVVTIGLFDGIGALRVAAEASRLPLLGHIAVEKNAEARQQRLSDVEAEWLLGGAWPTAHDISMLEALISDQIANR